MPIAPKPPSTVFHVARPLDELMKARIERHGPMQVAR
jgi:hypothetical protein